MSNPIITELKRILGEEIEQDSDFQYVVKCLNPNTPSHEIGLIPLKFVESTLVTVVERDQRDKLKELVGQVKQTLFDKGYRPSWDYWTRQEMRLINGEPSKETPGENVYTPIGILKGILTLEEAVKARELAKITTAFAPWFCLEGNLVRITLEPLDTDPSSPTFQQTTRNPRLVDDDLNPIPTQYSSDFLYRGTGRD